VEFDLQQVDRCPECGSIKTRAGLRYTIGVTRDEANKIVTVHLDMPGLGVLLLPLRPEEAIEIGEGMARAGRDLGGVHRNRG
jgi:hypothetical protein